MLDILAITLPIFILIGLGFGAVQFKLFAKADIRVLGTFVIQFALPAMLFKALSQRPFGEIMNPGYLFAYALGSLVAMGTLMLLAKKVFKRDFQASVIFGMGGSLSNSAFIGMPVAVQVLGPIGTVAMALSMLVENLLILPLQLLLADSAGNKGASVGRILRDVLLRLIRNPMLIAILVGFSFALTGLRLPQPVFKAIDMLSLASAAIALFVIGGNLAGSSVRGMGREVALITAGKLLLHPLAVLLAVIIVPGIPVELQAAAVLFACVPMLSIYAILGQKYGMEALCSAVLVVATIVSFVTISIIIWLVKASGMVPGLS
ncbi:AEC family transporter [Thauera sp. SDU_THAU2]|uniref:AEC family transporter n=1 Tax=Thauera sp. SDU_THAU2 TaxID=3136633 RepID=UPI00311D3551